MLPNPDNSCAYDEGWEYQFREPRHRQAHLALLARSRTSRHRPFRRSKAERNRVWLANREERRRAHSSPRTNGNPRERQDRTFYEAVWSQLPTEKEAAKGRRGGFLAIHAGEWSVASCEKYNRALRKHAAPLHQMRCSEIVQNDIVAVLSPIWTGPSWGQGTMLRGLIERVLMQEGRNPNPRHLERCLRAGTRHARRPAHPHCQATHGHQPR